MTKKTSSIKIKNVHGDFQEYEIKEEDFKRMNVEGMLMYLIHNNKNNDHFNTYFYKELIKIKEANDLNVVARRTRQKN